MNDIPEGLALGVVVASLCAAIVAYSCNTYMDNRKKSATEKGGAKEDVN